MTLLLSESALHRVVHEFYCVCMRKKLRVNVGKSKVMAFERKEVHVVGFSNPYRVSVPVVGRCEVDLGGERIEGRNVSMEVKRGLRNSIFLPTMTYGSEPCMWNRVQQSRVRAVEMSYLRGACGVTRWEGENNESMYE